jgi:hypothetical protein
MKDYNAITADAATVTHADALHELNRELRMRIGTETSPGTGVYSKKAKYLPEKSPEIKKMEAQAAALLTVRLIIADMGEKEFNRRRSLVCQPTLFQ